MGADSKIQWTDHTFNPWRGCSKVHTGCENCYAEVNYSVKMHGIKWGTQNQGGTRVVLSDGGWQEPVKWNRKATERQRVFCASLADVFEDWSGPVRNHKGVEEYWCDTCDAIVPPYQGIGTDCGHGWRHAGLPDMRNRLFKLIDQTPQLDWLLLTKRPQNIRSMWRAPSRKVEFWQSESLPVMSLEAIEDGARPNVWLGTSISDQATADAAIPHLLEHRDLVPVLFLSVEPLVGPVQLPEEWLMPDFAEDDPRHTKRWVIIGGESGPNARDCDLAWIYSLLEQCASTGVSVFVKQLGSEAVMRVRGTYSPMSPMTWLSRVQDKKAGDASEWPEDLRVRELPLSKHQLLDT